MTDYPIQSGNHAFVTGLAFGLALKAGLEVVPDFDSEGNYLASFAIIQDVVPNITLRLVVSPPNGDG